MTSRFRYPVFIALATLALFHGVVVFAEVVPHASWAGGTEFWTHAKWDALWYARIAQQGYEAEIQSYRIYSSLPFSPGWPMLLRAVHAATGVAVQTVRLPVAALLFTTSCIVLWHVLRIFSHNDRCNRWALALFAFSPGSMFFLTGYSETLYLPLLLLFFAFLQAEEYLAASIAVSFALFTRSPAIVLVGTLCVVVLLENLRRNPLATAVVRTARSLLLYVPVCLLGLGAYMLMVYSAVGSPLAFLDAYSAWYPMEQSSSEAFWLEGPVFAAGVGWGRGVPSMVTAGVFVALMPPLVFMHRMAMPIGLFVFAAISWAFFLQQNPPIKAYEDVLRWLALVFPFQLSIALTIDKLGRLRLATNILVLAVFVALYAINVYRFIHGQWVS